MKGTEFFPRMLPINISLKYAHYGGFVSFGATHFIRPPNEPTLRKHLGSKKLPHSKSLQYNYHNQ